MAVVGRNHMQRLFHPSALLADPGIAIVEDLPVLVASVYVCDNGVVVVVIVVVIAVILVAVPRVALVVVVVVVVSFFSKLQMWVLFLFAQIRT